MRRRLWCARSLGATQSSAHAIRSGSWGMHISKSDGSCERCDPDRSTLSDLSNFNQYNNHCTMMKTLPSLVVVKVVSSLSSLKKGNFKERELQRKGRKGKGRERFPCASVGRSLIRGAPNPSEGKESYYTALQSAIRIWLATMQP